ncbi:protein SpAN-like [Saccoglossus kowalevskii]
MTRIQAICAVFIILATVVFVTHVETRPEPPEEQPSPGTLESDIKLTKYQRQAIAEMVLEVESGASVRKALANLTYLWPNATLPYVISASSKDDIGGQGGSWYSFTGNKKGFLQFTRKKRHFYSLQ